MALPKLQILGRLTRDVEIHTTAGGMQIAKLTIAASERYKEKETQLFMDATAFGKTAEFIASVHKGQRIYVWGKLQTESWQNQNGEKRSKISMVIDGFEYIEKRENQPQSQGGYNHSGNGMNQPSRAETGGQEYRQPPAETPPFEMDEDSIPFAPVGMSEGGHYVHCI